jgi:hypothetical protein
MSASWDEADHAPLASKSGIGRRQKYFRGKVACFIVGDRAMPDEISSKIARAKLSEKKAWLRYAEAKGDDWQEAFAEWVEARDASLAAWADEVSSRRVRD